MNSCKLGAERLLTNPSLPRQHLLIGLLES
jgi:hypothetical protein